MTEILLLTLFMTQKHTKVIVSIAQADNNCIDPGLDDISLLSYWKVIVLKWNICDIEGGLVVFKLLRWVGSFCQYKDNTKCQGKEFYEGFLPSKSNSRQYWRKVSFKAFEICMPSFWKCCEITCFCANCKILYCYFFLLCRHRRNLLTFEELTILYRHHQSFYVFHLPLMP